MIEYYSLIIFLNYFLLISSIQFQPNDYEPRVFDYIPLNCYDCLTSRDIILTQLINVPARAFANFNLGSYDTNMILNGQLTLTFQPYAFESLIIQKPNKTLTLTLSAPNSWLNLTEKTFHGLDLRSYSTLRIIIKFFYACTFDKHSLSGIKMASSSRLIFDISSVTKVHFHSNLFDETDRLSSVEFLISRTETIIFDQYSFSSLILPSNTLVSFQFELISHLHLKSYAFHSLQLQTSSSLQFDIVFLNRLTIDSYAFQNISFAHQSLLNFTIQTLGTCLCLKSHTFDSFYQQTINDQNRIHLTLNTLRGLSFLSQTFSNITLSNNHLKISSTNPYSDPNLIINFASNSLPIGKGNFIEMNFSSTTVIRFEKNFHIKKIYFHDISFIDLSTSNLTQTDLYFSRIRYIKWFQSNKNLKLHFNQISNHSCSIYQAPRTSPWLFSNTSICNCPLLFAYKLGQLDGQYISCIRALSGHETARLMDQCYFDRKESHCRSIIDSLTDINSNQTITRTNLFEIDSQLIRQLYDRNYLACSLNYSIFSSSSSSLLIRSRLLNNFGLVLAIILAIFVILLILVMALLNGLQYKMREYDEAWTWRRNMSWTSLRRTISQTSLRRSRRDLRTIQGNVVTSKSENQLDRLRVQHDESDNEN